MKLTTQSLFILLFSILLLLVSCAPIQPASTSTFTPQPSATATITRPPSFTPRPTQTPYLTGTARALIAKPRHRCTLISLKRKLRNIMLWDT